MNQNEKRDRFIDKALTDFTDADYHSQNPSLDDLCIKMYCQGQADLKAEAMEKSEPEYFGVTENVKDAEIERLKKEIEILEEKNRCDCPWDTLPEECPHG